MSEILDAIEYTPAPPLASRRPTSSGGPLSPSSSSAGPSGQTDDGKKNYEHCFKIITPKRTFLVTAPTEEEEIKWLAALQCLVARRTVAGSSSNKKKTGGGGETVANLSLPVSRDRSEVRGEEVVHGRNRSITDAARAAVRDVENRFHQMDRISRT